MEFNKLTFEGVIIFKQQDFVIVFKNVKILSWRDAILVCNSEITSHTIEAVCFVDVPN